tara:strand:- start:443 stop:1126 length:684 start_codon:yes stop_codon:yes gene_type:complete
MIHFLVTAQYEAAIVKDHRRINAVLRAFPESVVYFNIDSRLPPAVLEQIVRAVINGRSQHGAEVGILSYNPNPEVAQRYLMELGATCGYVILELGFQKSARIIIKALEAAEARGDRRYVRVRVPQGKGTFQIDIGAAGYTGDILDISEAGMACILRADLPPGTVLTDIQLRLWGSILSVGGRIHGTRQTPMGLVYVIMFDEISDSRSRAKLYQFLRRVMQHEVDQLL